MRIVKLLFLVCGLAFFLCGPALRSPGLLSPALLSPAPRFSAMCSSAQAASVPPVSVQAAPAPAAPVRRIIPLYAGFTEILVALGAGDLVVARTDSDKTLPDLPRVGSHMRPNAERIAALSPDAVLILEGREEAVEQARALEALGIRVVRFSVGSFEELFAVCRELGVLTGREKEAEELAAAMQKRLDRAARLTAHMREEERPVVLFEVRYPNLLVAGQGHMASAVIRAAGGVNVLSGTNRRMVRLSEETLLAKDPDIYLSQIGPMNKNPVPVAERPHFQGLKAVRHGRVYIVDELVYSRPGPRSVEAVEALAAIILDWHSQNRRK